MSVNVAPRTVGELSGLAGQKALADGLQQAQSSRKHSKGRFHHERHWLPIQSHPTQIAEDSNVDLAGLDWGSRGSEISGEHQGSAWVVDGTRQRVASTPARRVQGWLDNKCVWIHNHREVVATDFLYLMPRAARQPQSDEALKPPDMPPAEPERRLSEPEIPKL